MKKDKIPEADMKAINKSFERSGPLEALVKDGKGRLIRPEKAVVNDKTITLQDFSGRVLKHQKSIFFPGKGHEIIGVKGDRYDDIPLVRRGLVVWMEDDFEK